MKKIETGAARPETFPEQWPGQCEVFSHLEYACGIPSILYAVTTYKENGLGNVCCGAWASFPGDGGGFYALVPLPASTHTLANIRRTGEFCVNFLPVRHLPCTAPGRMAGDERRGHAGLVSAGHHAGMHGPAGRGLRAEHCQAGMIL